MHIHIHIHIYIYIYARDAYQSLYLKHVVAVCVIITNNVSDIEIDMRRVHVHRHAQHACVYAHVHILYHEQNYISRYI